MANTLLQNFLAALVQDLKSIPDIANNFADIYTLQRRDPKFPALLIDVVKIDPLFYGNNYYGYYDLIALFSIFCKEKLSTALSLFDILIKNFNCYQSTNTTYNVGYKAEFFGGYSEAIDYDSQIITIVSSWKIRLTTL